MHSGSTDALQTWPSAARIWENAARAIPSSSCRPHHLERLGDGHAGYGSDPGEMRPIGREKLRTRKAPPAEPIRERGAKYAESVHAAAAEIDARRFREILRRAGYLSDAKAAEHRLRDHFIIEHKII